MKNILLALFASLVFSCQSYAQNLLCDPGFEAPAPNPCWLPAHLGEAGDVIVPGLQNSGVQSLHVYTGTPLYDFLSWPHQADLPCAPGAQFRGSAQLCTPPGFGWLANSFALVRVVFLDAEHCYLAHWDSPHYEQANPAYQKYTVTTGIAPPGTAFVRFSIVLEKQNGTPGQSVVEADDCVLETITAPLLHINPKTLEFGATADTLLVRLENDGAETISWSVQSQANWLTILESSGTMEPGTTHYLPVKVVRSALQVGQQEQGALHLTTDVSIETDIPAFVEKPPAVPRGPSRAWTQGRQLIAQKRLTDGCVSKPFAFKMKGVCLSEAGIETHNTPESRIAAALRWSKTDLALLRGMNANCIRVFLDFGFDSLTYNQILDHCYKNDIFVVMTVDREHCDTANIRKVVTAYKNHPAILCWAIGNEWSINHFNNTVAFPTIFSAAVAAEQAAQLIHSLDADHPVCSVLGDLNIPGQSPNSSEIINQICPSVDFWGLNVYPGYTFGSLFTTWQNLSGKPMFVAEYGIDSYRTQFCPDTNDFKGFQDEASQALWNLALWSEIREQLSAEDSTAACLGGTMFEFLDEWWKIAPSQVHDDSGYHSDWNPGAFPDSHGNEEHFGMVSIRDNCRIPKSIFYGLKTAFALLPDAEPVAPQILEIHTTPIAGGLQLEVITDTVAQAFSWSSASGDTSAAIIVNATGVYTVTVTFWSGCTASATYGFVPAPEVSAPRFSMSIAPNPATFGQTTLSLTLPHPCTGELTLADAQGRIIRNIAEKQTLSLGDHFFNLDTNGLLPGVYICFFRSDKWTIARKVIL